MKRPYSMTPKALEARRQNARHSTGPRTPRGRRWSFAKTRSGGPGNTAFPALNQESEKLLAGLVEAFEPADPAERLLVEELARLHDAKRRNQEAQEGLIGRTLAKLRRERAEHQREVTLENTDYPYRVAAAAGYFHMDDCPAKFREIARLLNVVKMDVEVGNFSPDAAELLKMLYGPSPSMRGARVLGAYQQLLESEGRLAPVWEQGADAVSNSHPRETCPPRKRGSGGPVDSRLRGNDANGGRANDESEAARLKRLSVEATRSSLLRALEEEKSLLAAKYTAYIEEHIPTPLALQRAALVPSDAAWPQLAQQDQVLDRQIENKTRLLLFMQWVRRRKGAEAGPLYSKR